jgi:DNA-directed RNA polymerase specialized sigma subunit
LICDHIPDAHIVANTIKADIWNMDRDHIISAGYEGLVKAGINYEFDKGVKFWSYAEDKVRGAILDEIREWLGDRRTLKGICYQNSTSVSMEDIDAIL